MKKSDGFFVGALIGGTAAAITALLLAPKSGKELRDDLVEKMDEFKENNLDSTGEFKELAKEKIDWLNEQASSVAGSIKNKTKSSFDTAQDKSEIIIESLKKKTNELSDHLKKTVDDMNEQIEEDIIINVKESIPTSLEMDVEN